MQVVALARYEGPKPAAAGPISVLWELNQDENHHQAQLVIFMQFGPNPPGSLDAGIRQTDSVTDRQTSSFIYKISNIIYREALGVGCRLSRQSCLLADYVLASSYVGAPSEGQTYSNRLISPVEHLDGIHCVRTTLMQTSELRVTVYVGNTTRLAYVGIDQLGPAWHWLMFDIEVAESGEAVPVQIVFDSRLPTEDFQYGAMLNDVVLTKGRCQDRCKNRFLGPVL